MTRMRNIIRAPIAHVSRADAPGHQANIHFFDRRRGHCNLQGDTNHLMRMLIEVLVDLADLEDKTLEEVLQDVVEQRKQDG